MTGDIIIHEDFHRDGSIRSRGQTIGGVEHGYWEWFRLDGSLMRSGHFDHGAQAGEWITYNRAGEPHKVTQIRP